MNSPKVADKLSETQLGVLLRHWRSLRGKSQFDLSLDTGVSQRHISFIESGRSAPGRQILMDIAQALAVPLRERNTLLLAAGYAPVFSDGSWDAAEMHVVTKAVKRMLQQHEPFPAVVMDRYWNVLMTNSAAPRFFNEFIDMKARKGPRNLLHLMFDPEGMRPFIVDWENVAKSLIQRVYRESVGHVLGEDTQKLLSELIAYPGVKSEWKILGGTSTASAASGMPVIPIGFFKGDDLYNYFSMVTTVGTPQTIAAQELRIECMFPADEATEALHQSQLETMPQ